MTLFSVLRFFFIIGEVLLFYNLIICVHELGHFWAARWRGLVIDKFAIWMGPALWKRRYKGVEYCLGTIPIGGYVALPQMAPMEAIEGSSENSGELVNLPPISPLDKVLVAFAGPLASFGLALFCATFVWWMGRPVSEGEATTVIGYVMKDSPAERGGLLAGDKIVEIDGHKVSRFMGMGSDVVTWRIVRSEGATIDLKVERDGQLLDKIVTPVKEPRKFYQRPSLRKIMVAPSIMPRIKKVAPDSAAALAGLQPQDVIIAVDGQKIYHAIPLLDYVEKHPNQSIQLTVQRGAETVFISILPKLPLTDDNLLDGMTWDYEGLVYLVHPTPWEQIASSLDTMANTLGALFSPKSDIGLPQLNGPVKIMHVYYSIFDGDQPWLRILWFSVLININLAILNLLPIPVLDGGHILMAVLEKIRGRPHNVRVLEYIMTGCVALVMGFIIYVSFFDVQDLPFFEKSPVKQHDASPASPAPPAKP